MTAGAPPTNSGPLQGGIELTTFGGPLNAGGLDYARALPYTVLWPGFAVNTLFYAALLWLLFAAPFALRRWRRIHRGLCPACGYPIGESEMCTECGQALPPRRGDRR